ncbi:unnamed protein product, partial [Mesorhabditis spiculigera]
MDTSPHDECVRRFREINPLITDYVINIWVDRVYNFLPELSWSIIEIGGLCRMYVRRQHLIGEERLIVIAGVANIRGQNQPQRQLIGVKQRHIHEKYRHHTANTTTKRPINSFPHDIALLELRTPIKLKKHVATKTILVKTEGILKESGHKAVVMGWGDIGEEVDNPITSPNLLYTILDVWTAAGCRSGNRAGMDLRHVICAERFDTGPCPGDSGGPLVMKVESKRTGAKYRIQIGVVSKAPPMCNYDGRPGIYMNVGYYCSWIERTTKIKTLCQNIKAL